MIRFKYIYGKSVPYIWSHPYSSYQPMHTQAESLKPLSNINVANRTSEKCPDACCHTTYLLRQQNKAIQGIHLSAKNHIAAMCQYFLRSFVFVLRQHRSANKILMVHASLFLCKQRNDDYRFFFPKDFIKGHCFAMGNHCLCTIHPKVSQMTITIMRLDIVGNLNLARFKMAKNLSIFLESAKMREKTVKKRKNARSHVNPRSHPRSKK